MVILKAIKRFCPKGHVYYKSSNCISCPTCEKLNKPNDGFLALLSAPARRAISSINVETLEQLSTYTEKQIMALHGIGPSSIPKLKSALASKGLSFKVI